MPQWLFPDSLADPKTYEQAQHFWERLWQKVLKSTGSSGTWETPWMQNPIPDGNPIFTAISKSKNRGVRIIHEGGGEPDDTDLDWWVNSFGEKAVPDATPELVIACCPSCENLVEVERLLREWVEKGEITIPEPATTARNWA